MEPPHYDSRKWTGDLSLDANQPPVKLPPVRSRLLWGRPRDAATEQANRVYSALLFSIIPVPLAIWMIYLLPGYLTVIPPYPVYQFIGWLVLIAVAAIALRRGDNEASAAISRFGCRLMLASSIAGLIVGIWARATVSEGPVKPAIAVGISHSRSHNDFVLRMSDGSILESDGSLDADDSIFGRCFGVRRLTGRAGFRWFEIVHSPSDDRLSAVAGSECVLRPVRRPVNWTGPQGQVALLIAMLVGALLLYGWIVRATARAVDRNQP